MNTALTVEKDAASAPAPTPAVLVVEDEVLIRMAVADHLRDRGFDVLEAGNAREAMRLLQAGIEIGVVFSDVNMPGGMDGFGLSQWMRRERPRVKMILTSGAQRIAGQAGEHGPVMAKPYSHAEVELRIRDMLAR